MVRVDGTILCNANPSRQKRVARKDGSILFLRSCHRQKIIYRAEKYNPEMVHHC